jgi:hypothetical protein
LREKAQMQVNGSSFPGNTVTDTIGNMFDFADINSHAVLNRVMVRYVAKKDSKNITFVNCSYAADGTVGNEPVASALFGNQQSSAAFRWTGGYLPSDGGSIAYAGGTTGTPSVDSTYGRKYILTPSGNTLNAIFYLNTRGVITLGTQYNVVLLCKLPTFTGGSFTIQPVELATPLSGGAGFDTSRSGQVVSLNINRRLASAVSDIGVRFWSGATGVSGDLEVYAVGIYVGNDAPRSEFLQSPDLLTTTSTAAPTIGEWKRGDRVVNSAPAVGNPRSWVCTVAGTPGTWVSEGNL